MMNEAAGGGECKHVRDQRDKRAHTYYLLHKEQKLKQSIFIKSQQNIFFTLFQSFGAGLSISSVHPVADTTQPRHSLCTFS